MLPYEPAAARSKSQTVQLSRLGSLDSWIRQLDSLSLDRPELESVFELGLELEFEFELQPELAFRTLYASLTPSRIRRPEKNGGRCFESISLWKIVENPEDLLLTSIPFWI